MDEQQTRAQQLARARYKEGFNCAEAVLRAFREELGLALDGDTLKIASGFGGGLGHAGCMCGALSGAVMVISLLQGRTGADQSRNPVYDSAREFHGVFADHFGATCCRVLNPHPFETSEQRRACYRITGETAELLAKFLAAKDLLPAGEQPAE